MGDSKDSKKIQADRAARKLKEKEQAKRSKPDTTSTKGSLDGADAGVQTPSQPPRKKGSK